MSVDKFLRFEREKPFLDFHHVSKVEAPFFEELWQEIEKLRPMPEGKVFYDKNRLLWIRVERGDIDEERYGEYPDEYYWYRLHSRHYKEWRAVSLNSCPFVELDPEKSDYPMGDVYEEAMGALIDAVRQSIGWLKDGSYDKRVAELPYRNRAGLISRREFWEIYPEYREKYYEGITPEMREELLGYFEQDRFGFPIDNLIKQMTASDYFNYAAICYDAMGLDGSRKCDLPWLSPSEEAPPKPMTSRELFYHYHDGRDCGLRDIDENSPRKFKNWASWYDAHKFEIKTCDLWLDVEYPEGMGLKCQLRLRGGFEAELIKPYLALRRKGLPVILACSDKLEKIILEEDSIFISPVDDNACFRMRELFPGVAIGDESFFDHLPMDERREKLIATAKWLNPMAGSGLK